METPTLHDEREWPYVRTLLPADLEDSARECDALVRYRQVPDAAALMRMALAYAVSDLSLKDVAAWAHALGVAEITGPGLFYRLRQAEWGRGTGARVAVFQYPALSGLAAEFGGDLDPRLQPGLCYFAPLGLNSAESRVPFPVLGPLAVPPTLPRFVYRRARKPGTDGILHLFLS